MFCRFDAREKSLLTYASHFSPIYGQRASMRLPNGLTSQKVAVLVLSHLRPEDEGVYKCRADFKRSPTRNNRMFLSILSKFQLGHSVIHPFSINDAKHREGGEGIFQADWIYGHLHKLMNTVYKGENLCPSRYTNW